MGSTYININQFMAYEVKPILLSFPSLFFLNNFATFCQSLVSAGSSTCVQPGAISTSWSNRSLDLMVLWHLLFMADRQPTTPPKRINPPEIMV